MTLANISNDIHKKIIILTYTLSLVPLVQTVNKISHIADIFTKPLMSITLLDIVY